MSCLNIAAACPKANRVLPTLQANGAIPRQTPFKGTRDKVVRSKLACVEYRLFMTSLPSLPLASLVSLLPCPPSPCTPSPDILKNPPSSGICCTPGFLSRLIILSVDSLSFFSSSQRPVAFGMGAHHSPALSDVCLFKSLSWFPYISCAPSSQALALLAPTTLPSSPLISCPVIVLGS